MPSGFTHEASYRGESDIWLTPRTILNALGAFDLDPCAAPAPRPWPTAARHYDLTQGDDGLLLPWAGRVFCNPPYGPETAKWLDRMAFHNHGTALVFARTETRAWQDVVFPFCTGILFLAGRVRFCRPDGTQGESASAPSALIAYGRIDADILKACALGGAYLETIHR